MTSFISISSAYAYAYAEGTQHIACFCSTH